MGARAHNSAANPGGKHWESPGKALSRPRRSLRHRLPRGAQSAPPRASVVSTANMAAAKLVATATDRLQEVLPESLKQHSKVLVLTAGGVVAVSVVRYIGKTWYRTNPFAFGRTGALAKDKIDDSINGYNSFFSQKDGKGIEINKKMSTPEFVDKFYRREAFLMLFAAVKHSCRGRAARALRSHTDTKLTLTRIAGADFETPQPDHRLLRVRLGPLIPLCSAHARRELRRARSPALVMLRLTPRDAPAVLPCSVERAGSALHFWGDSLYRAERLRASSRSERAPVPSAEMSPLRISRALTPGARVPWHLFAQASIKRYEVNIGKAIGLKPGMKAIDLGCGVGGPMRTIAKSSGAHVTGITINEYQARESSATPAAARPISRCSAVPAVSPPATKLA